MAAGVKIINLKQLGLLASSLERQLPGAMKVLGLVRSTAAAVMDMDIWVDDWPNYTMVIASPLNSKNIPAYINNVYTVYTTPDSDVTRCEALLTKCGVVSWKQPIVFGGIADVIKPAITGAAAKAGCIAEIMDACHVMQATADTLITHDVPLPEGLSESSLTPEDAALVTSRWKHGDQSAEAYIGFLIAHFSSVALRDVTGTPIAWFIMQNYGALGMLHVEPEYRRRGLAKRLIGQLSTAVIGSGRPAFVIVEGENDVSRRLHEQCGFRVLNGEDVSWVLAKRSESGYQTKATCCV